MFHDYSASYFLHNFNKTYQNVYAEVQDKSNHYNVVIYCPHAKNKDSVKKIMILNKHLLIDIGEREYRYMFADDEEYIITGAYLHNISSTTERCKRDVEIWC